MEDRKKILLVKSKSDYDMQTFIFRQIQSVLEKDYDVVLYEYDKEVQIDFDNSEYVKLVSSDEFSLLITMDMTGFGQRLLEDDTFYNLLFCPMINILIKDAWYFSHYLNDRYNFTMYFYHPFQESVTYIREIMRNFPNIDPMPPVGYKTEEGKPWGERRYAVYFPSTYKNPAVLWKELGELPSVFGRMAQDIALKMLGDRRLGLFEGLKRYLSKAGFEYEPEEFIDLIYAVKPVVEYVKMYHADACVRALLKRGIPVTVSGRGWEAFEPEGGEKPQILGENGLLYAETLKIMADSKIVLNNQYHMKGGIHSRVTNALMQGAVSLTNRDGAVEALFADGKELLVYDDAEELVKKAGALLSDEVQAQRIAGAGFDKAMEKCCLEETVLRLVRQQVEDSEW